MFNSHKIQQENRSECEIKTRIKIIWLELLDTELSSWTRKIQEIELDSQEVSHERLFKT